MKSRLVGREKLPIYIVGILLVLASFFAFQQEAIAAITGKIAGVVKDAETGEALPGANIIIVGTTMGAAADVDGYYYMINIPPGTYSVQARMMGYESVTQTGVDVSIDHTTPLNFDLKSTTIKGKGITVKAKEEIIKMDLSSSSIVSKPEEIEAIPLVTDLSQYASLQAGVEKGWEVRGGGADQTSFFVDGLTVVDNRSNEPLLMVNLSAIKEMNIMKGGFNAEHGNLRSGLINVVTKEGSPDEYHGSIITRFTAPHQKHRGKSIFDPDNWMLRPYLDPEVCWEGTKSGGWDEETQKQYPYFRGWNTVAAERTTRGDTISPEECRDLFIWLHRCDGADELVPEGYTGPTRKGSYGDKPDWSVDASFGGPVPLLNKYLSFFVSYRNNWEQFGLPTTRDYYKDQNLQLKLTSHPTKNLKITAEGLYGKINSVTNHAEGRGSNDWVKGGDEIFWAAPATWEYNVYGGGQSLYWPSAQNAMDVYRKLAGLSIKHALTSNTYYDLHITYLNIQNWCPGYDIKDYDWCKDSYNRMRDTTIVRYFGNIPVDESPYGFWYANGVQMMTDNMMYGGRAGSPRDTSWVNTINVKFDLTSQINKNNQIKTGFLFNYDDMETILANRTYVSPNTDWEIWDAQPYRLGTYIQDKIEFMGMIANIGVRLDYNNPNTDWFTVDPYSKYFKREYGIFGNDSFTIVCPKKTSESHLKISPRFGISHPITENAKMYFNYGHFYSMPSSYNMFTIDYGHEDWSSLSVLGNPSADLPKTAAYELGSEFSIADLFLLHLAGYYKDVTEQIAWINYVNYDGTVSYWTLRNDNYEDIRGFELRIEKRFGRWITGWLNYDYKVTTSGNVGLETYYEDPRQQAIHGLKEPLQDRPLARPIFNANAIFSTPNDWGPELAGIKAFGDWQLSFLYQWSAGEYMTWDPLNTGELWNNLQWKDWYNLDAQLSRAMKIGSYKLEFVVEVRNLLDTKLLTSQNNQGFADWEDTKAYLSSLHLPMYEGEDYQWAGYESGNDKPGDVKSDEKTYIDMPNRPFLTYLNPRTFTFGIRMGF